MFCVQAGAKKGTSSVKILQIRINCLVRLQNFHQINNNAKIVHLAVYAIEASDMAHQIEVVVKSNKMEDSISVIHGKVEVSRPG